MSRKMRKITVVTGLFIIILAGFPGSKTNPPVKGVVAWDSPRTQELFKRGCANCHSNETEWPWYSNFGPSSWLVIHNVNEAREKFNISNLNMGEAESAWKEVKKEEMPPWDYLLLHPEAHFTEIERSDLVRGLKATFPYEDDEEEGHEKK